MSESNLRTALRTLGELGRLDDLPGIEAALGGSPLMQALLARWAEDVQALQAALADLARLQGG